MAWLNANISILPPMNRAQLDELLGALPARWRQHGVSAAVEDTIANVRTGFHNAGVTQKALKTGGFVFLAGYYGIGPWLKAWPERINISAQKAADLSKIAMQKAADLTKVAAEKALLQETIKSGSLALGGLMAFSQLESGLKWLASRVRPSTPRPDVKTPFEIV